MPVRVVVVAVLGAALIAACSAAVVMCWELDHAATIFSLGTPILAIGATVAVLGHRARSLTQQIDAERARGDDVIAHLPIALARWDGPEHRLAVANAAYRTLLPARARVGETFAVQFPELGTQPLDDVFRTGKPIDLPEHAVAERHLATSLRAIRNAEGTITGVLAIELDVTERIEATEGLAASRAAAAAASRAKDEFLAMLGHELRNPLAPILTALELMRSRPDLPNERECAVIDRQTRHMMRLVDDMLDVSRITRGALELRRERADVADLISRSIEIAAPLVEQRRHELVAEVQHNLVVDGDSARLVQVLANLITNAAKYTEPGGKIRVTASRDREDAVITVRDTGRGIAPALMPQVFEMFVQEHQQLGRPQGGLGLGLAIAKSIVHLHAGTISAASDGPGTGSEFVVRLPLAARSQITRAGSHDASPDKPVVLLVDDNVDAADLLADLLRSRGCVVHVAHDGAQALERADDVVPDIALLDIGLPEMDGYELARRLRELPAWTDVRLVALTGYSNDSDRERSSEAGFERHLVKPIDAATVLRVVCDARDDGVPIAIN